MSKQVEIQRVVGLLQAFSLSELKALRRQLKARKPGKIRIPKAELQKFILQNRSTKAIAQYYKASPRTITRRIKAYGLTGLRPKGRKPTIKQTIPWAKEGVERGAGEILLTSMIHDGTKDGFAINITRKLSEELSVPIIASGGAGKMEHFYQIFKDGKADAALAASVFHFSEIRIQDLKKYLKEKNIAVRI